MSEASERSEASVSCAFVGILDVENRSAANEAYSPAGTHFQESLLEALDATALSVTKVLALRPVASFPTSRRLFFGVRRARLLGRIDTTLIPFINFGPLKTFTSGVALVPHILAWAWRERSRRRVVLLYNVTHPPAIFALIAGKLSRTPVVAVVADIQVPGDGLVSDSLLRRLEYALQVRTLPHCDGLVVLTRRMARDFAPSTPYIEMEGAVPSTLVPRLAPPDPDPAFAGTTVMYAGGLSVLKGVPLLLAAFERLEGSQFRLWITGRGPLEASVREAARRDPRIVYHGFPDEATLLGLYSRADVLVNPHSASQASARYLFPSKLIEYLATEVPVVSTPSTPEVGEQYGTVCTVTSDESAESLAAAIRRLAGMSRTERRALGVYARDFVMREKTWPIQARRIADFTVTLTK